MTQALTPLFWAVMALVGLLLLQRWIHTHLHGLSLLLTGHPERAVIVYALVLLPGVFLHELSHWLAATFLGVRTGSFSVIPRQQADGSIQLGYVEYYRGRTLDPVRESVIGGAPLITGTAVILLIGLKIFNVTELATAAQSGQAESLTAALTQLYQTPDFLVWLYLIFAIANGMMPSKSDRRAWPAFIITMIVLAGIVYLLGLSDKVMAGLAHPVSLMFGYLGLAFSLAIGVDLFFMGIIALLEMIISRVKGVSVVYTGRDKAVRE